MSTEAQFQALYTRLDACGQHCAQMLNDATPNRLAKWVASGVDASFDVSPESRSGCSIEILAFHHQGVPYLRVTLNTYSRPMGFAEAKAFHKHMEAMLSLIESLNLIIEVHGFKDPR